MDHKVIAKSSIGLRALKPISLTKPNEFGVITPKPKAEDPVEDDEPKD
jgi:hypothetical protein